jgi:hypothetical protein
LIKSKNEIFDHEQIQHFIGEWLLSKANLNLDRYDEVMTQRNNKIVNDKEETENKAMKKMQMRVR